jgi:hypothetical protein
VTVHIYDPDEVTISFGDIQIVGWAPGEFVRIEQSANDFVDVIGVYGEATRIKSKDHRVTVTFILQHTSASNDALSVMNNLDHTVPNGAGVGALMVNDSNGRAIYRAERAWIARVPNVTYGRTPTNREWTISCENMIRYDGGY